MAPPLLGFFLPILMKPLMKQLNPHHLYLLAEEYGFHRIYRRLLEGMKHLRIEQREQQVLKYHIKASIRAPTTVYHHIANHELMKFIQNYAQYVLQHANDKNFHIPSFFIHIATFIFKQTHAGNLITLLNRMVKK